MWIPTYDRVGWYYPFGWDTPQYLAFTRQILEYGYLETVTSNKGYPFGVHAILASLSIISEQDIVDIGLIFPLVWLIIYQFTSFFTLYEATRNLIISAVIAALVPFQYLMLRLVSHLWGQLAYTSLLPILIYLISSYVSKRRISALFLLTGIIALLWFLWPWGIFISSITLFSTLCFIRFCRKNELIHMKIPKEVLICILLGSISLVLHMIWQVPIFGSTFQGVISISRSRPVFTFSVFLRYLFNNSVIILLIFTISIGLSVKKFAKSFNHDLNELSMQDILVSLITVYNLSLLVILGILSLLDPNAREFQYRLSLSAMPLLSVAIGIHLICNSSKLKKMLILTRRERAMRISMKLSTILLVILLLMTISQFPPTIPDEVQKHVWVRWLSVNDRTLINSLKMIKSSYGESLGRKSLIIVPFNYKYRSLSELLLLNLTIRSFLPNALIVLYNGDSWNGSVLINYLPKEVMGNYRLRKVHMIIVIIREIISVSNLPPNCAEDLKRIGYCIIEA